MLYNNYQGLRPIPNFGFFTAPFQSPTSAREVERELELEKQVLLPVDDVIEDCKKAAAEIKNEDRSNFLRQLSDYLTKRKEENPFFSCGNILDILARARFIKKLIPVVQSSNIEAELLLLKEENIRQFKGCFTKRLYILLIRRRIELTNLSDLEFTNTTHSRLTQN